MSESKNGSGGGRFGNDLVAGGAGSAHQVQLTGRASRFVQLLVELGHLDYDTANRVLVGVTELVQGGRLADIADVRRAAAMVLFPTDEHHGFEGVLAEDWPILFS